MLNFRKIAISKLYDIDEDRYTRRDKIKSEQVIFIRLPRQQCVQGKEKLISVSEKN